MKEKSIWYQGGKAALVLLFAALMAVLFFSCTPEKNVEIKFMHVVWIIVGIAMIFNVVYFYCFGM